MILETTRNILSEHFVVAVVKNTADTVVCLKTATAQSVIAEVVQLDRDIIKNDLLIPDLYGYLRCIANKCLGTRMGIRLSTRQSQVLR